MTSRLPLLACLLILVQTAGCGTRAPLPSPPVGEAPPCLIGPPGEGRPGPIQIAVADSIDLRSAPVPRNESERILYHQVFETLVGVDCGGSVVPALAQEWRSRQNGRIWEFTIRKNARFGDGSSVSTEAVREAWIFNRSLEPEPDRQPLWSWVRPESLTAAGGHLVVSLSRPLGKNPRVFAHVALAVSKMGPDGDPLGTGPYVLERGTTGGMLLCTPNLQNPNPGRSPLRLTVFPGADSRDLIGSVSDAAVVPERDALSYAGEIPEVRIVPLGWNRIYLLASPSLSGGNNAKGCASFFRDLRRELAVSVLQSEAKAVSGFTLDGEEQSRCPAPPVRSEGPPGPSAPRVLFDKLDKDAGEIAARVVALAGSEDTTSVSPASCFHPGENPVGSPRTRREFRHALAAGSEWVYVVGLRFEFPDPCLQLASVLESVPWMSLAGANGSNAVPLVLARSSLVYRRNLVGVEMGWDGVPLFYRAGWAGTRELP